MLHVVLEGPDGTGKSTTATTLTKKLTTSGLKVKLATHPGATSLGAHLRTLVKNEKIHDVSINSPFIRQSLFAIDWLNFVVELRNEQNYDIVISDRCSPISSIIYGKADGLSQEDLQRLNTIYNMVYVEINTIYLLQLSQSKQKERKQLRGTVDYFESKPQAFFDSIYNDYNQLPNNSRYIVKPIDASETTDEITSIIYADIVQQLKSV